MEPTEARRKDYEAYGLSSQYVQRMVREAERTASEMRQCRHRQIAVVQRRYEICLKCIRRAIGDCSRMLRYNIRCDTQGEWYNPWDERLHARLCKGCRFAVEHVLLVGRELPFDPDCNRPTKEESCQ